MLNYEYGRIKKLAEKLKEGKVNKKVINQIMKDGQKIKRSAKPEKKAEWMKEAMQRMDQLLDPETRNAVREACACCLGGWRLKAAKKIAKEGGSLEERLTACTGYKWVFGKNITWDKPGRFVLRFAPEGQPHYRCVCLPKAQDRISLTYCYCCGGHMKHHLQIALGKKLACKAITSTLASRGKKPCTFEYTILD